MKLFAPDGVTPIVGTKERIPGCAELINEDVTRNADGTFDFQYEGHTKVYWDDQVTLSRVPAKGQPAQRIFIDEDGDEHLECDLVLQDEIEEEDEQ